MQVTGIAVSPRHPYMFSCGLDKMVKCWDLETNKVNTSVCDSFWHPCMLTRSTPLQLCRDIS